MMQFKGTGVSAGCALGPVFIPGEAGGQSGEPADFEQARAKALEYYASLGQKALETGAGDMTALFDAYALMLEDPDLEDGIKAKVAGGADPADAARETGEELSLALSQLDDEYMRERAADVKAVCKTLGDIMSGTDVRALAPSEPCVLVCEDLTPAEAMALDKSLILAIVLRKGAPNGHTAILAQTLGIPAVMGTGFEPGSITPGTLAAVDGSRGAFVTEPDGEYIERFRALMQKADAEKKAAQAYKDRTAVTPGGRRIEVMANIGSETEAEAALAAGCDGIGLFRTEFLYLRSAAYPTEEEQFEAYSKALKTFGDKEVIIRTCDIGSDKTAPYFDLPREENPALGLRAIRLCLQRPEMFLVQLRAILRASVYGRVKVMFPMVVSPGELRQAKALWQKAQEQLTERGVAFDPGVPLGVMIETPAAALMSDELAEEACFFSIGTNDLTQYTLAADRQSESVSGLFDAGHPAVRALIEMTVRAARKHNIPVGICGNSAADPALLGFYIKAGIDELSVSPAKAAALKMSICNYSEE